MMFVMFAMEIVYKITDAIKTVFILTLRNYVMLVLHKKLVKVWDFLPKIHLIGNFWKLAQLNFIVL